MVGVARVRTTIRAHPLVVDVLVAAVTVLFTLVVPPPDTVVARPVPVAAAIVTAGACLALLLRRRRPVGTLVLTLSATVAATLFADGRPLLPFAVGVALYSVGVHTDRRRTVSSWIGAVLVVVTARLLGPLDTISPFENLFSWLTMLGVFAAVGDSVRSRHAYVAAIEERALRAEQNREQEARRRVAEDRLHIARELHDVVAHHVAVVSVQAGVAEHLVFTRPRAAYDALQQVHLASSAILDELAGILGVLRRPDEETAGADPPAAGLHQLDALVASYAAVGLHVEWSLTGTPRPLADTVDLVAYRVVQEALTNAHKHGTGTARVTVRYAGPTVALEVTNRVREAGSNGTGTGYGLLGMQERAVAVGGAVRAGPAPGGGFRVTATLPVQLERAR